MRSKFRQDTKAATSSRSKSSSVRACFPQTARPRYLSFSRMLLIAVRPQPRGSQWRFRSGS
jgi:hypothetical protein